MLSINLGPFTLAMNHLVLLTALLAASVTGWLLARKGRGRNPESTLFTAFMIGLVAARLGFVGAYLAQYLASPWQVLDIRDGGFLFWPGVAAALAWAAWRGARQPALRQPLLAGVVVGLGVWAAGSFWQATQQASGLPQTALQDSRGQAVQLAQWQGQPMVVNLWATWCPPCRREIPALLEAAQANPHVQFIFVNQGEEPGMVGTFAATAGLAGKQLLFDRNSRFAAEVGSQALPTTLFYSAQGELLNSHLGELSPASLSHALKVFESPPPGQAATH